MSKRPPKAKKSVSFSDIPTQAVAASKLSSASTDHEVQFTNALLLVPYHYLIIVWTLFKHYQITVNQISALKQSFFLLLSVQIAYGYIIQMSIKKKKKEVSLLYNLTCVFISLASSFIIFIILILFGAPFLSLSFQTFLLSLHLSLTVVYPLLITFNFINSSNLKQYCETLIGQFNFKNQMYVTCAGCIVGTWLGCFPIPLDWDRDWQTWPITLLVGGYIGGVVGAFLSILVKLVL